MGRRRAAGVLICVLAAGPATADERAVDYARDVKPIFEERCWACHGALTQQAGLRLDAGQLVLAGSDAGAVIVPGRASESLLVERITAEAEARMPPLEEGSALTAGEIAVVKAWIDQGAKIPGGEAVPPDPREHWAFRGPVKAPLPTGVDAAWTRNPIDAFVGGGHEQHGLAARPAAEQGLLLRRVYLDLIGLPPTREELRSFLGDRSPDAYERVVDRLLASPRYGERWGRHWMDVWRYSDWYGRRMVPDVWNSAPQVWRWRDWIVRSLNEDKGYDCMVQEMLAADEIAPGDPDAAVATGYLVRNWYALNPNEWMRHNVEHTAKAFLGLTFNCAHCHNHKYDPITQEDYFRLRAFFEPIGIRQDRAAGEADPGPFQEYEYSTLRKIVRLGTVAVFDKNPEAPTWFYTGGDERNRVQERGTVLPGIPAIFGELPVDIEPIDLPPPAWYPGLRAALRETVLAEAQVALRQREAELAAAQQKAAEAMPELGEPSAEVEAPLEAAVAAAEQADQPTALGHQSLLLKVKSAKAALAASSAELASVQARIEADRAKYGEAAGADAEQLALA
ncbi:MAG: DUF1549 domain-containing protein, partial [Pirellulales bacterium]